MKVKIGIVVAIVIALLGGVLSTGVVLAQTGDQGAGLATPPHGYRYETPVGPPKITQEQAIQMAKGHLGPGKLGQATSIEAHYTLFSNDGYHVRDAQGRSVLAWQRVPAWVVTFKGLNFVTPGQGYRAARGLPYRANHELNVVINAETGEYMQGFTNR